jgi:hypothetical protein
MKILKYSKVFLLSLLILSWLTVPLLGRDAVKRYFLSSFLIAVFVRLENIIAIKRKWWWFYEKLHPKLSGTFPLIWGPFIVGSMWILKYTYGKFKTYLLVNLCIDTLFTYPFMTLMKKAGIGSLVRFSRLQLSLLFFSKSLLLYAFQYYIEKYRVKEVR